MASDSKPASPAPEDPPAGDAMDAAEPTEEKETEAEEKGDEEQDGEEEEDEEEEEAEEPQPQRKKAGRRRRLPGEVRPAPTPGAGTKLKDIPNVAYSGYIRLFDARKFEKGPFDIFSVGTDDSEANIIKFSSDGRQLLLTTKAGRIHVLDSFHGNNIATYNVKPVGSNSTLEASFSPDGNHIISGSGDGSVFAWNVRSGKVARWGSTDSEPPLVRWAPGSLMFLTGSSELSCWVPDLSKLGSFTTV